MKTQRFFEDDEDDLYTDLTEMQEKVLDYIEDCVEKNGLPPTRAEMAKHFGWKSPNNAEQHIKRLAKLNRIEVIPNVSRGIRLVAP